VSANEAAAIGDVRTIISAQITYASANDGFFDNLECLATPHDCIPGYPAEAPYFIGQEMLAPVKNGYQREFHPGPTAAASRASSPSSIESFAYVAVPLTPGTTGTRAFCGDSTGRVCFTADGSEPEVVNGACSPDCLTLN
jgi:hypothetical protein